MIRLLIDRQAVIGTVMACSMLYPDWKLGHTDKSLVTLRNVTDHIDHVCQLAGNAEHAALGSDLDGGFGKEQSPSDLDTIADLAKIADILTSRGYTEADINKIMYENWLSLFKRAWRQKSSG
jgi:membrane dipeptidase